MTEKSPKKVCLITGATGGLGKELSKIFFSHGYNLLLSGRNEKKLSELENFVAGNSISCSQQIKTALAYLNDQQAPEKIIQTCLDTYGRLDILINNAAIHGPIGPLECTDTHSWEEAVYINFLAPVSLCRLCIPLMKKNGWGRIINISGGGASGPRVNFSAYASAKTALVRFSETLAAELHGSGITVNCVAPGPMPTALLKEVACLDKKIVGEKEIAAAKKTLANENGFKAAADLCLFLASDHCGCISGKLISALWDNYEVWPQHERELQGDLYTLRRICGRDRNSDWGDK